MANTYIHLDSVDTLEEYRHKLEAWKRELYRINDEMRNFHNSLEQDQRWYGHSHTEFYEDNIGEIYDKFFQPAAEAYDEAQEALRKLQVRAEEIGIK